MGNTADTKEVPKMVKFSLLPEQTFTDEDEVNFAVTSGQFGQHHATIETAANERADGSPLSVER